MEINELAEGKYYILLICEGTAEEDIMNHLIDNNLLIFSRSDLIDYQVSRIRSAESIQEKYLNLNYEKPVAIIRVLDSKHEKFKLGKAYQRFKSSVINVITSPEIEILLIIYKGDYNHFSNSRKSTIKPSQYCSDKYRIKKIKSKGILLGAFNGSTNLLQAIKRYKQLTNDQHYKIADFLR